MNRHLESTWKRQTRVIILTPDHTGWVIVEVNNKKEAFLYNLWVEERYRGQGFGKYLLQVGEQWAKARGAKLIRLEWNLENSPRWVLEWYMRKGYDEKEFGRDCALLEKEFTSNEK